MRTFGTILCIFLSTLTLVGQRNLSITGTVLDRADSSPIALGSVELRSAKDSTLLKGAITNDNGAFSLQELNAGNYILQLSYLGYETATRNLTLRGDSAITRLGNLYLEVNEYFLEEAVVKGKVPEVVVRNDTLEYNADAFKTTENAALEELLKKMPGVEVDKDGKIKVNGKDVSKFLVEGKEFYSDDPTVASRNLPAEMVQKVQVVDRKSEQARLSGFDDGEEETIINLVVREGMKQGLVGNALAGGGKDLAIDDEGRYQAGAFANMMKGNNRYTVIVGANNNNNQGAQDLAGSNFGEMRMRGMGGGSGITEMQNVMASINQELSTTASLNADVRLMNNDRNNRTESTSETYSATFSQMDEGWNKTFNNSKSLSANMRFEWKPDTTTTLIVSPNIRLNQSYGKELGITSRYDISDNPDDKYGQRMFTSDSHGDDNGQGYRFGGNLTFAQRFAKYGRVLTVTASGNYNSSFSQSNDIAENDINPDYANNTRIPQELNQRGERDNRSTDYRLSGAWVEPLGNNNSLQLRYEYRYSDSETVNSTYEWEKDPVTGDYYYNSAVLLDSLSRSTVRNSTSQRAGINFQSRREKYNYTIGFNVDPSSSTTETWQPNNSDPLYLYGLDYNERLANILGDSLVQSTYQKVVNYSPTLDFNYLFGSRSNLRVTYNGSTNQPSATQLRNYIDMSRPTNWNTGNPDLKPGYRNTISARFQKYVTETQLQYNISGSGGFSVNDITAITGLTSTGVRLTSYDNINGNWNASLRGSFSMPLRNKKFTIGGGLNGGYSNANSYTVDVPRGVDELDYLQNHLLDDKILNTQKSLSVGSNANARFRNDLFEIGLNGSYSYNDIVNTVRPDNNRTTHNWRMGLNTTWYLPYNWTIDSDLSYVDRRGLGEQYDMAETIWNAFVSKQLFSSARFGTGLLKLQCFDILQNRKNISANVTTNGINSTRQTILPSYFMCTFIYKFTQFGGSSARRTPTEAGDEDEPRERMRREGGWERSGGGRPGGGGFPGGGPPM